MPLVRPPPGGESAAVILENPEGWSPEQVLEIDKIADVSQAVTTFEAGGETVVVGVSLDHFRTPEAVEDAVRDILEQNLEASRSSVYMVNEGRQLSAFADIVEQSSGAPLRFGRIDVEEPALLPADVGGRAVVHPAPGSVSARDAAVTATQPAGVGEEFVESVVATQGTEPAAITKWSPNWFNISAGIYAGNTRWGRLLFAWDYSRMYNLHWGFSRTNITFEPDFKTNNYDGLHFYSDGKDPFIAWSSNMPCAYRDTRALDGEGEQVYTIGCYDAHQLNPDVKYYTHFVAAPGNTKLDKGKAAAQPGYRVDPLCGGLGYAWCISGYPVDSSLYPKYGQWTTIPTAEVRFFATDL